MYNIATGLYYIVTGFYSIATGLYHTDIATGLYSTVTKLYYIATGLYYTATRLYFLLIENERKLALAGSEQILFDLQSNFN